LGCAYAHARQPTAFALLERAVSRADAMKVHWRHSLSLIHLAEGYLVAGREAEARSEEHTSELQSRRDLVCRLLLEKKKKKYKIIDKDKRYKNKETIASKKKVEA